MNSSYIIPGTTLIGAGLGAGISYRRQKKSGKGKISKSGIAKGAAIGGAVGAGVGIAGKKLYGVAKNRYHRYIHGDSPAEILDPKKFKKGDLIKADRGGAEHYAVVVDDKGTLVEYGADSLDPRKSVVRKISLKDMAGNSKVSKVNVNTSYTPDQIAERALGRVGKDNGKYHLLDNNCEHFAREVVTGKAGSEQADKLRNNVIGKAGEALGSLEKIGKVSKMFSSFKNSAGDRIIKDQLGHFVSNGLFKVRKGLTRNLGGLSHFNRHQTTYLAGGGSVAGGLVGRIRSSKKAKKDAKKYGLKPGTLEYDKFIQSRKDRGTLKGMAIGGGIGALGSKGVDFVRGKVIADKFKAKTGNMVDLGKDYLGIGKGMRGIRSEKDLEIIKNNFVETGDYTKALVDAIK